MGCRLSSGKVEPERAQSDDNTPAAAATAVSAAAAKTPASTKLVPPSTPKNGEGATPSQRTGRSSTERIKWRKGDLIGMGANGRVYLGLEEDTGAIIAVKEILFGNNSDREELEQMQGEIELLRSLSHPNIVTYLGTDVSDDSQTLFIFTEWVPGGSIQALVTKFGRLPEAIVRKYVAQLLVGLSYLHERQVIHRDVKAANILVDDRGNIKLADFGSSKRMDSMGSLECGEKNNNHSLRGKFLLRTLSCASCRRACLLCLVSTSTHTLASFESPIADCCRPRLVAVALHAAGRRICSVSPRPTVLRRSPLPIL